MSHIEAKRTTTYTTKDGLPSDAILALFEDRRGEMWVGTCAGLTRIVNGKVDPDGKLRNFPRESVSAISESRDGSIWVGMHERGMARIQPHGAIESLTTKNGLSSNFVLAIHEDSTGAIWIGTMGGGLNRYKNGRMTVIRSRQGLQDDSVFAILEDRRGNLWMSSNKGHLSREPRPDERGGGRKAFHSRVRVVRAQRRDEESRVQWRNTARCLASAGWKALVRDDRRSRDARS